MKRDEGVEVKREGRAPAESKPSAVLRAHPRLLAWLGIGAATLAVCLLALGGWLALRLDRRVDALDARYDVVRAEVGELEGRNARSQHRLAAVGERLRVVSHPLRASISWPVSGPLLERYGPRGSGWHSGIDVDAPEGAPVSAAAPGIVVDADWEDGYGNRVVVAHGRGLETTYAHLAEVTVGTGAFVTESSRLGTIGCTGSCDGAHLHFEVRLNGSTSDPLLWLPPHPSHASTLPLAR
jgi:murein DD-endopeptidase MepM/ murein hydrolase activator NlpD